MSIYSGKCDFYDHFEMYATHESSDNKNILISNDDECFKKFMDNTGGVLHQQFKLELTKNNIDYELNHNKSLKKNEDGTYTYFGQTYKTLKSIKNYHAYREIHIENLIDLVQYFPYIITTNCYCDGKEYIEISSESYVDHEEKEMRKYGYKTYKMVNIYRQELSKYYKHFIK